MRILLVEDDSALSNVLTRVLREEAYAVDLAEDGVEAEWHAFENPYDLVILDLMLPRKDGLSVLRDLRKGGIHTPVLILTAKDDTGDVVKGLDLGADDYLTKPFSVDELLARVRALFRRQPTSTQAVITVGPLKVDPSRKEVYLDERLISFTTKEYALMEYFARNPGTVLSRTQLSEHVWDMNFEPTSNVVDVYIGYLRTKLDKNIGEKLIKTVRGHGYMLDPEAFLEKSAASVEAHP